MCHPEAQPKDLANVIEILRFAQNDSSLFRGKLSL